MNTYVTGALVSLILCGMAVAALILGIATYRQSNRSAVARRMLYLFACVFIWDLGYAWMGLCYDSDFAYVARAIALAGVYIYMIAAVEYVGELSHYPRVSRYSYYVVYAAAAVFSWIRIIDRSAVTFRITPWGYWYVGKLFWGRYVQFACILFSIVFFFIILAYWRNSTMLTREHMIIKRFMLFAPILFAGYLFDTLIPSMYDMPAIPGSAVTAFISAMLLYGISGRYMAFGIYERNISRYVFRDVRVPVLVADSEGRIVMWNKAAPEYFDKPDEGLYGVTMDELVALPDEESLLEDTEGEEIHVVNGRDAYCRLSSTAYHDDFGDHMYTIYFVQDVSDIREAMNQMNDARRIAEEANATKNVFLANMSHEVRTPMNAIIGTSDILLADPDVDNDTKQQIRDIHEAADSMLGIINDVLDISKIESGHNEMVENPYSLPDMIHAIGSMIRMKIAETTLEYIVDADADLPTVLIGDEMRVRQIFLNILSNAINLTEKGYIHLKVWGVREYGGLRMYVDFADTGMGMHPEETSRVFEAFNQIDTHRKRSAQGPGLGLSISRRLARAMDGDITAESEYGHGTVFHLNIFQRIEDDTPIGESTAASIRDDSYEFKAKDQGFEYHTYPGSRILVVDDSRVNLKVAKGLLAPYEMVVDLAADGEKAVELAARNDYDIILMDHMMPVMDGVETTHAIRKLGGYNRVVPIIALTANAVDGTREMLLAEGMQGFIPKPVDKRLLNDVIEEYCHKD